MNKTIKQKLKEAGRFDDIMALLGNIFNDAKEMNGLDSHPLYFGRGHIIGPNVIREEICECVMAIMSNSKGRDGKEFDNLEKVLWAEYTVQTHNIGNMIMHGKGRGDIDSGTLEYATNLFIAHSMVEEWNSEFRYEDGSVDVWYIDKKFWK